MGVWLRTASLTKTMNKNNEPDLITLLMAISLLHIYRSFSKEDLLLLLAVEDYKKNLMRVPYEDENYQPEITRELKHRMRIDEAHELAYKELLLEC